MDNGLTHPRRYFWYSERIIFLGTLASLFVFAVLLSLTESGNTHLPFHSFLDFFFDSTSVGTLTGLFRGDSGAFTFGGQVVLLLDMFVNGLIASFTAILLVVLIRFGLDRRSTLRSEIEKIGVQSKSIVIFIFVDVILICGVGASLFAVSGSQTVWEAIFNSASHVFNDGVTALPNNMIPYNANIPMLLSGAFLVTIGGLGISIRGTFYKAVLHAVGLKSWARKIPNSILAPRKFLITILVITAFLQIFGAASLYGLGSHNAGVWQGMSEPLRFVNCYYMSVSARTAGFTTLPDLTMLHDKANFILMLLMVIGASSGSFGGGVLKLTAFLYMIVYLISRLWGEEEVRLPNHYVHLSQRTALEADFRIVGFTMALSILLFVLFLTQPDVSGFDLAFEAVSAVSNTGLTLGVTNALNTSSMVVIIVLMTMGKIGFIATITSFFPKYQMLVQKAESTFDDFPVD